MHLKICEKHSWNSKHQSFFFSFNCINLLWPHCNLNITETPSSMHRCIVSNPPSIRAILSQQLSGTQQKRKHFSRFTKYGFTAEDIFKWNSFLFFLFSAFRTRNTRALRNACTNERTFLARLYLARYNASLWRVEWIIDDTAVDVITVYRVLAVCVMSRLFNVCRWLERWHRSGLTTAEIRFELGAPAKNYISR